MRRVASFLLLLAGLAIGASPAPGAEPEDLDKLEGTWAFTSIKSEGMSVPGQNLEDIKFVVVGTRYKQAKLGSIMEEGTLKLDPTKTPGWITLEIASGDNEGKTQVGIYRLDGNMLTLCMAPIGKPERPTEFVSREASKDLLFVLKRSQP